MKQPSLENCQVRRWIVSESSDRWLNAARRFAPVIMPEHWSAEIVSADPGSVQRLLADGEPAVVLWEAHRDRLVQLCECLSQIAIEAPRALQIITGASELSQREQILLAEFPLAATIRHPEDLASLAAVIHVYFARDSEHLDLSVAPRHQ